MANRLTIGRLAAAADVNVETIRYYQRRGLLDEPPRPLRGQRYYSDDYIKRLRFIRRAQGLGFTLEEIRELLAMDIGRGCVDTRELAVRKQAIIEQRLLDLKAIYTALGSLVAQCDRQHEVVGCPILEALGGGLLGNWGRFNVCLAFAVLEGTPAQKIVKDRAKNRVQMLHTMAFKLMI